MEGGVLLDADASPPSKKPRNKSKKKEATLEEDLQFSSEEELDEVPLNEFEDNKSGILISAEMPVEQCADDDSQQAAEAMVQLGQMSYYQQNEGDVGESLMFKGTSNKLTLVSSVKLKNKRKIFNFRG